MNISRHASLNRMSGTSIESSRVKTIMQNTKFTVIYACRSEYRESGIRSCCTVSGFNSFWLPNLPHALETDLHCFRTTVNISRIPYVTPFVKIIYVY